MQRWTTDGRYRPYGTGDISHTRTNRGIGVELARLLNSAVDRRGVNLVENVGGRPVQGVWETEILQWGPGSKSPRS